MASLFNSFPELCGTTLLMSSLSLFVYNIHQQPCMDSTPDGVAANSLRSGVFATCVVTGVFSLVALALNRPQDETLTWIYCGIAPCVFCCAYLVNRPVAVNRKEVRGKSVERDFEALIQRDEATNSVRLDEMAGFFEDKLFARTDPQHFLQLFPFSQRPWLHVAFAVKSEPTAVRIALTKLQNSRPFNALLASSGFVEMTDLNKKMFCQLYSKADYGWPS